MVRQRPAATITITGALLILMLVCGCGGGQRSQQVFNKKATKVRPFEPVSGERWLGNAISYGPHRDGQRPGGASPTAAEVREDLLLMLPHWNLLRVYGASEVTETILEVIRADKLDMKVMVGVWVAVEESRPADETPIETFPEAVQANQAEVAAAIRLANAYPEIVLAVSVGNETQISWSAHRSPLEILMRHVRTVRAGVKVPVTVADDFNFWNKPESRTLAHDIDFITVHAHPMWNGLQRGEALSWLKDQMQEVQNMHPNHLLVLGETGWATAVHDQGEQAQLIKGLPDEEQQRLYYKEIRAWAEHERQTVFFFEAFDENWKAGPHPAEVEKNWGLFRADRTAKLAISRPETKN